MDLKQLVALKAISDNPEIVLHLDEKLGQLAEQEAAVQALIAQNEALVQQAASDRAAAEAALGEATTKEAAAADSAAGLASAMQSHQEETARFAEVRKTIEDGHAAKDDELKARARELQRLNREVKAGQAEQAEREDWLKRNEDQMAVAMEHAQKLVEVFHGPLA